MGEQVIWGGRYAIYEELASGGMATVYLAGRIGPHPEIPAVVALKKLSAQFAKQPEFVAMFLDEAHLAARIRHKNVVPTYEFLRTDEGLGIVMDLVIGLSLMQLSRGINTSPQIPAPLPVTLSIIVDALDGLHAAHEVSDASGKTLDLVHRDISPHNIIVGIDGVARVIDFGIAKAAGRLQITEVGVLKGKFAYMAPEQIKGAEVDRRADVYATGIVLWEALTGRKLFRAASNEDLLMRRTEGEVNIPPPSSMNEAVTPALDAIVARALANEPNERFGSARAMADQLRRDVSIGDAALVSEWVRGKAGDKLGLLEAKRRSIEAKVAEESLPRVSVPTPLSSSALIDIPESIPSAPSGRLSRPGSIPDLVVPPRTLPSAAQRPFGDITLDPGGEQGHSISVDHIPLDPQPILAPRLSAPSPRTSSAGVRIPTRRAESRSYRGWLFFVFLLFLAGSGGAIVLEGPALLRARVLATGASYGLALTIDHVELGHGGLRVMGAKAALVGCPSVRFTAAEVDVALDRTGTVESMSIPGFDLAVSGTPGDVLSGIAEWRKGHHTPVSASGKGGHAVWTGATLPGVIFEALDVTLDVASFPETTFALDSPSVVVTIPRGHLGPWRGHLESSPAETRGKLALDPSTPDGPPSASFVERQVEGTTWALDVPRESTFKVGLPMQLFGASGDLSLEVALHAHLSPQGDALTAEGQVGLYGWEVGTGKGTVDLVVSGSVAGNPTKRLPLTGGKLAVGKVTNPVGGSFVTRVDGVRVEIDRPFTHAGSAPALVFDTNDWTTVSTTRTTPGK